MPSPHTLARILESQGKPAVLGLAYSGMHDTATAIVTHDGRCVFAAAEERFSRVKQDGRTPTQLREALPWERVAVVAVPVEEHLPAEQSAESVLHPQALSTPRAGLPSHGAPFHDYLATLPPPKQYVCHQLSHAASAFWLSGMKEALCLTYDGGMWNSPWFGGLYIADRHTGIRPLDRFSAAHYAKISSLYSIVTAILGFSPNKHEGKVTGLAAYGRPTDRCRRVLGELFVGHYLTMESVVDWRHVYSTSSPPMLRVHARRRDELCQLFKGMEAPEVAATLQQMTEEHVLELLDRARQRGWVSPNLCVAGGLFANVKLNQRIKSSGFARLFVAPPMTDDGTAVGAALAVASASAGFAPEPVTDVYWGPSFALDDMRHALDAHGLVFRHEADPAPYLAEALHAGRVVGVFQGRMEFGPRALGNRSILSRATEVEINTTLNERLRRTEFMPFAPVTRAEDAAAYYVGLEGLEHTAQFMTVTCACTERMRRDVPAVVHVDGTARPQILHASTNPLIHSVLTHYKAMSGIAALINTSFNVHEEPIVCSPDDAVRGFLEAGLDILYLEGGYIVSLEENLAAASAYLRRRLGQPGAKELQLEALNDELERSLDARMSELEKNYAWATDVLTLAEQRSMVIDEQARHIQSLSTELRRLERALETRKPS